MYDEYTVKYWDFVNKFINSMENKLLQINLDTIKSELDTVFENEMDLDVELKNKIEWCIFGSIRSQFIILNYVTLDPEVIKINYKKIIENAIESVGLLFNDYFFKIIEPQIIAAHKIQTQWRKTISDPEYNICKNRLLREYNNLIT